MISVRLLFIFRLLAIIIALLSVNQLWISTSSAAEYQSKPQPNIRGNNGRTRKVMNLQVTLEGATHKADGKIDITYIVRGLHRMKPDVEVELNLLKINGKLATSYSYIDTRYFLGGDSIKVVHRLRIPNTIRIVDLFEQISLKQPPTKQRAQFKGLTTTSGPVLHKLGNCDITVRKIYVNEFVYSGQLTDIQDSYGKWKSVFVPGKSGQKGIAIEVDSACLLNRKGYEIYMSTPNGRRYSFSGVISGVAGDSANVGSKQVFLFSNITPKPKQVNFNIVTTTSRVDNAYVSFENVPVSR